MKRFWVVLGLVAACGEGSAKDYGDPTALSLPTDSGGISAWVVSPERPRDLKSAELSLELGAYVTSAPTTQLEVSITRLEADASGTLGTSSVQRAEPSGEPGPSQRFKATLGLTHGDNRLLARIASADRTHVRTLAFTLQYTGSAPGASIGVAARADDQAGDACKDASELSLPLTRQQTVCVHGRVTSDAWVSPSARLTVNGGQATNVSLDAQGRYTLAVTLPSDQRSELQLEASAGTETTRTSYSIQQDRTPPRIELVAGARETSAAELSLAGDVRDESGIAEVAIENARGGRDALGPASHFERTVRLSPGDNALFVVAEDRAGNQARLPVTLSRVRVLRLGAAKANAGATNVEVDRKALSDLLTADDQKSIELAAIDLEPAVRETLARIREPERYGVDTSSWGAPERNLQRILRMTPDSADLSGTSVAELLRISSAVSLPSPRMLGDLLSLAPTDYIVDLNVAAKVIVDGLVGTHPNIARDSAGKPVLAINMYDVLQDLRTIATRFAASGSHPGFLSGESRGSVLEPGFLLTFPVTSNLLQVDAIDLSRRSKDFLFLLEGDRVLDFNVLTDDFAIVGLVDEPSIDLRFLLKESPTAPRAGTTREAGADTADPGFFRGNSAAFALPPYTFEHIAAELGYRQFHRAYASANFQHENRYNAGSIVDAAVIGWNRGWVTIRTAGGLGAPPPPLYAWDLLMEVAQARLHDQGVAEGAGDMAFALKQLPIGLTADELIAKLRPKLAEQEKKLSDLLVGSTGLATSRADLFFMAAPGGGEGALLFRADGDGGESVKYAKPGFYADTALTRKVSSTGAGFGLSDTKHEKVSAAAGATYYAADDDGSVYELKISARDADGVGLEVRRVGGTP